MRIAPTEIFESSDLKAKKLAVHKWAVPMRTPVSRQLVHPGSLLVGQPTGGLRSGLWTALVYAGAGHLPVPVYILLQ